MVSTSGPRTLGATRVEPLTAEQIWGWLGQVPDPEIPAISVVELGIVREVRWERGREGGEWVITVTPTYCGCPAMSAILIAIACALHAKGVKHLRLARRLAPPWTTEWISIEGRRKLRESGIAPPAESAGAGSPLARAGSRPVTVWCPRCGSGRTERISAFGSTPCKAQYRCQTCLEPFDYFKCI